MEIFGYRTLIAYKKAKEVVKRTYKLLKKFPAEERFAMCDQLRRASVSITSNIAEGINRFSVKDKAHFIEMSYGSLMEVSSQFEIAEELGLVGVVKDDEVKAAARQAVEENPKAVEDYHNGEKASLNFLMGQVMRLTKGKADPRETVKILKELLEE